MANAAKNTVRNAASKAAANEAPANTNETGKVDASSFVGKLVKVTSGRKNVGETFKAFYATKGGKWGPSVLAEGAETLKAGVTPVFLNPKSLEIIGDVGKDDMERLTNMQKAQQDETIYVVAFLRSDKSNTDNAIQLSNKGWAKDVWFAKAKGDNAGMISLTDEETPDGEKIFEVAAWKIRKELGMDAYNAIKARQPELAAIVERKS